MQKEELRRASGVLADIEAVSLPSNHQLNTDSRSNGSLPYSFVGLLVRLPAKELRHCGTPEYTTPES